MVFPYYITRRRVLRPNTASWWSIFSVPHTDEMRMGLNLKTYEDALFSFETAEIRALSACVLRAIYQNLRLLFINEGKL